MACKKDEAASARLRVDRRRIAALYEYDTSPPRVRKLARFLFATGDSYEDIASRFGRSVRWAWAQIQSVDFTPPENKGRNSGV